MSLFLCLVYDMNISLWEWYLDVVFIQAVVYCFFDFTISICASHNRYPYQYFEVDRVGSEVREYNIYIFLFVAAIQFAYSLSEKRLHLCGIRTIGNTYYYHIKLITMITS